MTTLDARLDAALRELSAQPDGSPERAAQLRAALVADEQRLAWLNEAAQAGRLQRFAIANPDAPVAPVGHYDPTSGVLSFPAASFQAGTATASDDLKATVAMQAMVEQLLHDTYTDARGARVAVTPSMTQNLQDVLNGSPALAEEVKRSIREGHLERFAMLDPRLGAGGTYNDADKSMNLAADSLTGASPSAGLGEQKAGDLTFVMGHEIQHSFNQASRQGAWNVFQHDIEKMAKSLHPEHDYSAATRTLLEALRWDEARAEVAGWNALVSRASQGRPNPTLADIASLAPHRAKDFVELKRNTPEPTPLTGFTFREDHSLDATPANVERVAHSYFDKPASAHGLPGQSTGLGFHHEADYTNYYGRSAVERIIAAEHRYAQPVHGERPKVVLDMEGLGLDRRLIERQGLSIDTHESQRYFDSSQVPAAPLYFHHTQEGANHHEYVPPPITAPSAVTPPLSAPAPLGEADPIPTHAPTQVSPSLPPDAVRILQMQLNTLGLTDHRGQAVAQSGVYDAPTRMAVMGFQQEHGLPATGFPDKATLSLVQAHATVIELQSQREERADTTRAAFHEITTPLHAPQELSPVVDQPTSQRGIGHVSNDPRHPDSPRHGLYLKLQDRLPDASEARLLQCTAACHERGITDQNLKDVHVDEAKGVIAFGSGGLIARVASVDLRAAIPTAEQSMQHILQRDQHQAYFLGQMQVQPLQFNTPDQQGAMLGR